MKQDVGALGIHGRNSDLIGSLEGQGGFCCVDNPVKGEKWTRAQQEQVPFKAFRANGIIT